MSPAGKKWKGRSFHKTRVQLEGAQRTAQAAVVTVSALRQQERLQTREAATEFVLALRSGYKDQPDLPQFKDLKPEYVVFGGWACEASPLDHCVYDDYEDPMHDDCLFCHDPQERK